MSSTHVVIPKRLKLYKRARSSCWQAAIRVSNKGEWTRITTGCDVLAEAQQRAIELHSELVFKEKHGIPVGTRRFSSVAKLVMSQLEKGIRDGTGKRVHQRYVDSIKMYLLPFFGAYNFDSITQDLVERFDEWRVQKMGREPSKSSVNHHSTAMNLVWAHAASRGWIKNANPPNLKNRGTKSERRPAFTRQEYAQLVRGLRYWANKTNNQRSVMMRELLRDYVLVLANTGIRHGTESMGLRWRDIDWYVNDKGQRYLQLTVNGKTGRRQVIARHRVKLYLERIQSRAPELASMSFDELLKARRDELVFRLRDGSVSKNLHQTFRAFLREHDLAVGSESDMERTLYSLRHTYATFQLVSGISIHALARQMGTSVAMLETHYSKLTPMLLADEFAGRHR